jgi:hypothetical protein
MPTYPKRLEIMSPGPPGCCFNKGYAAKLQGTHNRFGFADGLPGKQRVKEFRIILLTLVEGPPQESSQLQGSLMGSLIVGVFLVKDQPGEGTDGISVEGRGCLPSSF